MTQLNEAMHATNRLFEQEVAGKGNLQAIDQIYTADARILPPGSEMIEGIEAIRNFWGAALKSLEPRNLKLTSVETIAAGDGVMEVGKVDADTLGGQLAGKYVVFWKQEHGAWKWHVDIWNLNS